MDKELLEVAQKYGSNDWGAGTPVPTYHHHHHHGLTLLFYCLDKTVANAMSISVSRNQVRERYGVLLPSAKKGPWTAEEDAILAAAMGDANPLKVPWPQVAKGVPGRSGKQCRDRCVRRVGGVGLDSHSPSPPLQFCF